MNLAECGQEEWELLLNRSELRVNSVLPRVKKIVSDVRSSRDKALLKYTEILDGVKLEAKELKVSNSEFRQARKQIDKETLEAIESLAEAIRKFHSKQLPRDWMAKLAPGIKAGQLVRPLNSAGVYVPGGLASYPSSLLMAAVPAKVAGVEKVIVCTPPKKDGKINAAVLVAARVADVDAVFKVGGAQAIAAMAYGTESVPKVDKIVGPGNVYVAAAKQVVSSDVGIDFTAGPSEILIISDGSAEPRVAAADLLAQAEHDVDASAVLVTNSKDFIQKVQKSLYEMTKDSPRREVVLKALSKYGKIVLVRDIAEAIEFANDYAPEHLELMVRQPRRLLKRVKNAGSIFLGNFSPVAAGDLAVGPNHILPTGGASKQRSGLSVLDFIRLPTVQELSKKGLQRITWIVERLAGVESLPEHARSVKERL